MAVIVPHVLRKARCISFSTRDRIDELAKRVTYTTGVYLH